MKFGNSHRSPYYQAALHGITGSFHDGTFDVGHLEAAAQRLRQTDPRSPNHAAKLANNSEMLRRFVELVQHISRPNGEHTLVWRNALMEIDGVRISVRPEVITHCPDTGLMSFIKFRFSKSAISQDASEIVLLLLLQYALEPAFDGAQLDVEQTLLVDCFSRALIRGHQIPRIRQAQLTSTLADIRRRWPRVTNDGNDD